MTEVAELAPGRAAGSGPSDEEWAAAVAAIGLERRSDERPPAPEPGEADTPSATGKPTKKSTDKSTDSKEDS